MEIECFGFKKMTCVKYKACWVGDCKKVLRQLMVSLKSYLIFPFIKKDKRATQNFFEAIYSAVKVDDLIFDGNDHSYLEKIESFINKSIQYDYIYDCGCGNGAFLNYVVKEKIEFNQYIGIDFAIPISSNKNRVKFVKSDVENFDFTEQFYSRLVVVCNVACYLSDNKISNLLHKIAKEGTTVLIIDPVPGVFWDATFDRVKLFYRSPKKMVKLLHKHGYILKAMSKDYLVQIKSQYLFPLSYAGIFYFSKEKDTI